MDLVAVHNDGGSTGGRKIVVMEHNCKHHSPKPKLNQTWRHPKPHLVELDKCFKLYPYEWLVKEALGDALEDYGHATAMVLILPSRPSAVPPLALTSVVSICSGVRWSPRGR